MTQHTQWFIDTEQPLTTADGKTVQVWEFRHQPNVAVLSAWAAHFRNHYCGDGEIDALRDGTGRSRTDYLNTFIFPDRRTAPVQVFAPVILERFWLRIFCNIYAVIGCPAPAMTAKLPKTAQSRAVISSDFAL